MLEIIQEAANTLVVAIALIVIMLVWALKEAGVSTKLLPFVSAGIGAVIGGCIAVVMFQVNLADGVFFGVAIGLAASGGYDAFKSIYQRKDE